MRYAYTEKDLARFWAKVDKSPHPKDCWLWTAGSNRKGYGTIRWGRSRAAYAHRISYLIANGDCPDNLLVRHTCDNPRCVNPEHLLLGTNQDNRDDCVSRGRTARGERTGAHKLTWVKVRALRKRYHDGGVSQRYLGEVYGVCPRTVWQIIHEEIWKE